MKIYVLRLDRGRGGGAALNSLLARSPAPRLYSPPAVLFSFGAGEPVGRCTHSRHASASDTNIEGGEKERERSQPAVHSRTFVR